ncbi:Na+/H+ antiporter subunit E [Pseudogemmobacter lacusdianii]
MRPAMRLWPHPILSLFLTLFWLILADSWTFGSLVMGGFLGLAIPLLTAPWWPDKPRLKRPALLIPYIGIVLYDVVISSLHVARVILFLRPEEIRSTYVAVETSLTSPEAIALLAGTITMTPGTLTADLSADGKVLLIHALHAPDPQALRDDIHSRYEARLKRIFA